MSNRTRIVQIKYSVSQDKTIKMTQVLIGGIDRLDTPTVSLEDEKSWFIEGENEQVGDVIMLTLVRDPNSRTQAASMLDNEVEGMFASRKRIESKAAMSGHKLTYWEPIDKHSAGRPWIGATCLICSRVLELEPVAPTPERVAHYKPRTSFHLRKCQLQD